MKNREQKQTKKSRDYTLEELVEKINESNLHDTIETGKPVGNELKQQETPNLD